MTDIPEEALQAAARAARMIEPNLYKRPHNPDRYYKTIATEILEAALPFLRPVSDDPVVVYDPHKLRYQVETKERGTTYAEWERHGKGYETFPDAVARANKFAGEKNWDMTVRYHVRVVDTQPDQP